MMNVLPTGFVGLVLLWILAMLLVPLWISVHLGNKKGQQVLGWVVGTFLGWIGVVIMLVISPSLDVQRQEALRTGFPCPFCQEPVRHGASVCPHCQRDLGRQ